VSPEKSEEKKEEAKEEAKQPTAIEATLYQSELLKQIMQVGSLFNLKAFGTDEETKDDEETRILRRQ
jgi:hypothetical protein